MAFKKVPSMCPDCYLVDGMDTPMEVRPGQTLKCPRGHTWGSGGDSDSPGSASAMEIYDQRQAMARHKRAEMAKQADPASQEPQGPVVPAAVQSNTGAEIIIDKESRSRIASLVGDFSDGSSLFGTIFSLTQDIKDLQDQLRTAQNSVPAKAIKDANPGLQKDSAGDMPVTILVPERHVVPLRDISEAQGCDVPTYVNSIVAGGLDNGWFY